MQLFELHNAVSRTIGDPVENTGSLFVDGVRYSTQLRAQYINQAMNDILIGSINRVSSSPHFMQVEVLERLFPSMLEVFTSALPIASDRIAFICSAYYTMSGSNPIALPVVKSHKAIQFSLGRNTNVQPSDPFIVQRTAGIIQVVGLNTEDISSAIVTVQAIRRPPNMSWLSDVLNATEQIDEQFEMLFIPEVIRKVSLLAQLDSGELGRAAEAYPYLTTTLLATQQQ